MDNNLKAIIKSKGWSYRKAARFLSISFEHLNRVANGHYKSKRLERRVEQLPSYELFITANPNFFDNPNPKRKRQ